MGITGILVAGTYGIRAIVEECVDFVDSDVQLTIPLSKMVPDISFRMPALFLIPQFVSIALTVKIIGMI